MKHILIGLAFCVVLVACSSPPPSNFAGTWNMPRVHGGGSLTLNPDGTAMLATGGGSAAMQWTEKDGSIVIIDSSGQEMRGKLSADHKELHVSWKGEAGEEASLIFVKPGAEPQGAPPQAGS